MPENMRRQRLSMLTCLSRDYLWYKRNEKCTTAGMCGYYIVEPPYNHPEKEHLPLDSPRSCFACPSLVVGVIVVEACPRKRHYLRQLASDTGYETGGK